MTCISFAGIARSCGANPPGLKRAFLIREEDLTSIGAPSSHVVSAVTPKAGKAFAELQFHEDTGGLDFESVGLETDSAAVRTTFECFIPGVDAAKMEVFEGMFGNRYVVIAEDKNGTMRIAGEVGLGLKLSQLQYEDGRIGGDRKGTVLALNQDFGHTPYIFDGTVPVTS